jgi:hypothetical protein
VRRKFLQPAPRLQKWIVIVCLPQASPRDKDAVEAFIRKLQENLDNLGKSVSHVCFSLFNTRQAFPPMHLRRNFYSLKLARRHVHLSRTTHTGIDCQSGLGETACSLSQLVQRQTSTRCGCSSFHRCRHQEVSLNC